VDEEKQHNTIQTKRKQFKPNQTKTTKTTTIKTANGNVMDILPYPP
jgi:hypothetical protein